MKKLVLSLFTLPVLLVHAQWSEQASGFIPQTRGVNTIAIADANVAWVTAMDGTNSLNYITEFSKTSNGGINWNAGTVNTGISGAGIANISAINADTAWACVFQPNQSAAGGIFKTTDGGISWNKQTGAAFTAASFPDFVYFWDANYGITVGDPENGYFEVYTTSDGGTTWTRTANSSGQLSASALSEYAYTNGFSVSGNTLWFCTTKGRIFKTTDKGMTFSVASVGNGISDAQRVTFADADTGYACMRTGGNKSWKIARSTDGGATWAPLQNNSSFNNTMILGADICAVPGTNALVSVGSDPSAIGSTYSHDGGLTWHFMEDTTVASPKLSVRFKDNVTGWAGAYNQNQFTSGIYKFNGVVGIAENVSDISLSVFPNPTSGTIFISSTVKGNITTNIYSADGRRILCESIKDFQPATIKEFDLSSLPPGIYFLEIISERSKQTRKIVKQ